MKQFLNVAVMVTPLLAIGILSNAQVTRTRTAAVAGVITTSPANLSQFQVEGALITQNSLVAPAAANVTGSFTNTARWNSMGNLNAGTQTLNGFRTQTNGRALASGHSIVNATNVLSNPFIQWIGNATAGVTPGTLEFKFAVNPGGVGVPAPDVTLFRMAPTAAGTGGDSYAQNGILGHLQTGTFGDIGGTAQWLGHGPARISGVLDPTIYGNRIQQGAQSMLFNLVSGKPVVGWGDQGQDMVFRYFPNRFNPSLFTDVLTLQSTGRSNFGPSFSTTSKVSIRGIEANGLEILVKTNPIAVQIGGDAVVITATQAATGFYGRAQSDGTGASADVLLRNIGVRGQAGTTGTVLTQLNIGVSGEANPNSSGSTNYGVYGVCPASSAAAFTAGGYFVGGLYADGVIVMSDLQLKKNVQNEGGITSRIMQLRPVNYQLDQNRKGYSFNSKLQHGFIAQEMEKVFPELVTNIKHPIPEDGKTRFEDIKGVNYVGLVSVLTRGMQEQQQQIISQDEKIAVMEKEIQVLKILVQTLSGVTPAKTGQAPTTNGYDLKQNIPNPFTESAIISFSIPATERNASIAVFDLNGRLITQYNNLSGKNQVTINANELQPGIYLYSLLAGGQEVLTKRMLVTK
jgi:Chaperone of endosialidase/Secretion system C-terminal sorting domain